MKIMKFRPELFEKVRSGEKTVTRRLKSSYDPFSKVMAVANTIDGNLSLPIMVLSVREEKLGDMTDGEAVREGFRSVMDFKKYWIEVLGYSWSHYSHVYRIEFTLYNKKVSKKPQGEN